VQCDIDTPLWRAGCFRQEVHLFLLFERPWNRSFRTAPLASSASACNEGDAPTVDDECAIRAPSSNGKRALFKIDQDHADLAAVIRSIVPGLLRTETPSFSASPNAANLRLVSGGRSITRPVESGALAGVEHDLLAFRPPPDQNPWPRRRREIAGGDNPYECGSWRKRTSIMSTRQLRAQA